ncbi:7-carboxy-7-deazaguanine synthase QueE [Cerasicoccus maritimus]|uniref:7-carboxy-7-deazaguanine synthase QueE n=1 Tax=Cerasicoccus maritimus TaxID=490089 RepID=UPI00285263BA|nr:7-carboxy-7-deazaguanine synthase QueE [Cerasicoccus maritimus]
MTFSLQLQKTYYPTVEYFGTFQGEGCHSGRSAFFIRTYGCPVHCPWCDSANTWHPDHRPKNVPKMSAAELIELAIANKPDFVVITGGEPAVHDLAPLTTGLREAGLRVHIETSGTFPLKGDFDWVTVSPKLYKDPLPELIQRADELKLIVENADSITYWEEKLGDELARKDRHVWLHPEWGQRENPDILALIADTVHERGAPFRAGWQLHKLYRVL